MQGAIRLFKFSGIQVYLHFSWLIFAVYAFTQRIHAYEKPIWSAYEYLALFAIVLMHEFGHALACRQTGGSADQIVLWPLGGIAYVDPPRRAGAVLWSIAAGPLVNVALVPVIWMLLMVADQSGWKYDAPDMYRLLSNVRVINLGLLIFNLLPVYPLDGGQILRALLWFPLGEIRSLQIAAVIGIMGAIALAGLALLWQLNIFWTALIAFFLLSRAIEGWRYANAMVAAQKASEAPPIVPRY